jgi:NAD(P)-dependent dehydrogenase (short-subunit alcohol dehydrogenase family)
LAEKNIRVNTVHPSGVATPMVINEPTHQFTAEHPEFIAAQRNLLPVDLIDPVYVSEAVVYLCGHSGRYVTGITMPVDAGLTVK